MAKGGKGGHAKRTTATKRSKKFKREIRSLNKTMTKGKRSRGAGMKLQSSTGAGREFDKKAPIEEVLGEVKTSASAAITDTLDARSIMDLLMNPDAANNSTSTTSSSNTGNNNNNNKKNNNKRDKNDRGIMTKLDSSKLDLIRSQQTRDEEQEQLIREKAEQAEKARRGLDVDVAANRNRYGRHGPNHAFWRKNGVAPELLRALEDMNFTHPTPVQEKVLPHVLSKMKDLKKDLIVSSETGSGKTLLFALPTLQHLLLTSPAPPKTTTAATVGEEAESDETKGVTIRRQRDTDEEDASKFEAWDQTRVLHTLVLSPTRELAEQIYGVYCSLASKIDRRSAMVGCVLGGMSHQKQQRIINRRPHILIATPGRVWDLVKKNEGCYLGHSISRRLSFLVLDEADRLLQSGHYQDLHHLLDRIRCEVLPSGLIVSGSAGGIRKNMHVIGPDGEEIDQNDDIVEEVEDGALVSGTWDPVKNKFIPHNAKREEKKQESYADKKDRQAKAKAAGTGASSSSSVGKNKKNNNNKKNQNDDDDDEDELLEDDDDEDFNEDEEDFEGLDEAGGDLDDFVEEDEEFADEEGEENEEDFDEEDEDEDDEKQQQQGKKHKKEGDELLQSKDFIRPMVAPPPPPKSHRPITLVTSATLTLQTNFSHRNVKTKHYLQTNTVNTLARVLHDLGIKERYCDVFDMTVQQQQEGENANGDKKNNNNKKQPGVVSTLHETYARCPQGNKDLFLIYFLRVSANAMAATSGTSGERIIIFVNAISMLRRLYSILSIVGFRVGRLHSSMQQRSRLSFIEKFRSGELNVLIATDIASRGLDVDGVRYVVHYQSPRTTDAYIHRCGRTARCGGTGFSLLLINPDEFSAFRQLLRSMNNRNVASMEVYTPETASRQMKDIHEVLKVGLQIDKLEKEISKSTKDQRWVSRQAGDAEIEAEDMINPELAQENREKAKVAKILRKRLGAMIRDIGGRSSTAGRAAFLSTPRALGTLEAVKKIRDRTKNQMYLRD